MIEEALAIIPGFRFRVLNTVVFQEFLFMDRMFHVGNLIRMSKFILRNMNVITFKGWKLELQKISL